MPRNRIQSLLGETDCPGPTGYEWTVLGFHDAGGDPDQPAVIKQHVRVEDAVARLKLEAQQSTIGRLGLQIEDISVRVRTLEKSAANQSFCTTISSLGVPGYRLLKPIPVTIRPDGDEFIATFFDANISSGGDTQQEAVANLQSLIADFYDELAAAPQEELGPSLQRQKHVLVEFVCRT